MRRSLAATLATTTTLALAVTGMPAAQGSTGQTTTAPTVTVLTSAVAAPFNLALDGNRILVADGFASKLYGLSGGQLTTVASGPQPGDVSGVAVSRNRQKIAYVSSGSGGDQQPINGALTVLQSGRAPQVTSLAQFEARKNPDQHKLYGVKRPSACVRKAFAAATPPIPVNYRGAVDSHPYSVAAWGKSSWIVADAGGNDLVKVNSRGRASLLALLPKQRLKVTKAIAKALKLPDCVVGITYAFESVPTDVEVHGRWLYVSTLPGGPEDPSLGSRGSVYRVNPRTGHAKRIAKGLAGATNVAVARNGKVYVAELFGNRISVIKKGKPRTVVSLPGAVSVEISGSTLYAGTVDLQTGKGSVVKIALK